MIRLTASVLKLVDLIVTAPSTRWTNRCFKLASLFRLVDQLGRNLSTESSEVANVQIGYLTTRAGVTSLVVNWSPTGHQPVKFEKIPQPKPLLT